MVKIRWNHRKSNKVKSSRIAGNHHFSIQNRSKTKEINLNQPKIQLERLHTPLDGTYTHDGHIYTWSGGIVDFDSEVPIAHSRGGG